MSKKFYLSALGVVLAQAVSGFNFTDYSLGGKMPKRELFLYIYIYIYIYITQ
jgi:hypothetical protein